MPKRPREHVIEEESRRFCRDLFPSQWVVREKSNDYGVDLEVEEFDENEEATGLIFYVQLKATDSSDQRDQAQVRISADKFKYWLGLDCPTILMRYCNNGGNPHVYWMINYDQCARRTESGRNYVFEFTEENLWSADSIEQIRKEIVNDRLINAPAINFPVTLELVGQAHEIIPHSIRNRLIRKFTHFIRVGRRKTGRATIVVEADESDWTIRIGRRNCMTISREQKIESNLGSDFALAAGICLYHRNHSSLLSRIAVAAFREALVVTDAEICGIIATALLKEGNLKGLHEICRIAIRRNFTIDPFKALLFVPVSKAQLIESEKLVEQLANYGRLIVEAKEAGSDIRALILYAKGSFEVTTKCQEDALKSFQEALQLDSQISNFPMVWAQTANLYFWKKDWNLAAVHYLLTLKLQGERHWETKGNFADTQWRRGSLGSAIFWLRKVVEAPDEPKDSRIWWFRFLLFSLEWTVNFVGGSRFRSDAERAIKGLKEIQERRSNASIKLLTDLVKSDLSRVELWELLVEQADGDCSENGIRFEMMATACDYSNVARWASLVIRCVCDDQIPEACKKLIFETAHAVGGEPISVAIRVFAERESSPVFSDLLHSLADAFESEAQLEFSRVIRPLERTDLGAGNILDR
ncbi:DUF4365 domain-containing protein [Verrucomicrobiales bacterium BCK34]|nr:DUF4365 domain-containing protein [Verrucomicrobiales bacterium BCK34]